MATAARSSSALRSSSDASTAHCRVPLDEAPSQALAFVVVDEAGGDGADRSEQPQRRGRRCAGDHRLGDEAADEARNVVEASTLAGADVHGGTHA